MQACSWQDATEDLGDNKQPLGGGAGDEDAVDPGVDGEGEEALAGCAIVLSPHLRSIRVPAVCICEPARRQTSPPHVSCAPTSPPLSTHGRPGLARTLAVSHPAGEGLPREAIRVPRAQSVPTVASRPCVSRAGLRARTWLACTSPSRALARSQARAGHRSRDQG